MKGVLITMRRPITYAELLLAIFITIGGVTAAPHLYEFITDKISIEIRFKDNNGRQ